MPERRQAEQQPAQSGPEAVGAEPVARHQVGRQLAQPGGRGFGGGAGVDGVVHGSPLDRVFTHGVGATGVLLQFRDVTPVGRPIRATTGRGASDHLRARHPPAARRGRRPVGRGPGGRGLGPVTIGRPADPGRYGAHRWQPRPGSWTRPPPPVRPRRGLAAAAPAAGGVGPRPAARARQRPRGELRRRRRRVAGDAHPARRVVVVPVGCGLPGVARRGAGRRGVRGHRAVGADAHGRAADRVPGPRRPDLRRAPPRRRAGRRGRRVPAAGVRATADQRRRALRPAAVGDHHHRARRVARVASAAGAGPRCGWRAAGSWPGSRSTSTSSRCR